MELNRTNMKKIAALIAFAVLLLVACVYLNTDYTAIMYVYENV